LPSTNSLITSALTIILEELRIGKIVEQHVLAIGPKVTHYISTTGLVNALIAGRSANELELEFSRLSSREECQAVLCTCCIVLDEARKNCRESADEMTKLLTRNCELFAPGRKVCRMGLVYGMEHAESMRKQFNLACLHKDGG
jgi:hypothetical protein